MALYRTQIQFMREQVKRCRFMDCLFLHFTPPKPLQISLKPDQMVALSVLTHLAVLTFTFKVLAMALPLLLASVFYRGWSYRICDQWVLAFLIWKRDYLFYLRCLHGLAFALVLVVIYFRCEQFKSWPDPVHCLSPLSPSSIRHREVLAKLPEAIQEVMQIARNAVSLKRGEQSGQRNLQYELDRLQVEHERLQDEYRRLQHNHQCLQQDRNRQKDRLKDLQIVHVQLQSDHKRLTGDYERLDQDYSRFVSRIDSRVKVPSHFAG